MSHILEGKLLYDITVPLSSGTVCFPGDLPPSITRQSDVVNGDSLTASYLKIGCHVGTHIDAPCHFLAGGLTVDALPLETFYGPAEVVDCRNQMVITAAYLQSLSIPPARHILLQTDNSALLHQPSFHENYTVMSPEGASYLCTLCPLSIGFDYYCLDPLASDKGFPAHMIFATAGISVFVCLDLLNIQEGQYLFAGFPLRLEGAEGSPVRALLIER
ncbi:MAG: cyclase family protein [Nitrospirota bacterium]|nr:cyclase family protein [Nitrospirota bacterium]